MTVSMVSKVMHFSRLSGIDTIAFVLDRHCEKYLNDITFF